MVKLWQWLERRSQLKHICFIYKKEFSKNKTEMPIPKNQKTNRYPADVYIENHAVKAKST